MKFKKYLPLIIFLVGLGVVTAAVFFVVKNKGKTDKAEEEVALLDVPLEQRPVASLTPTEDGHWLKMVVEKLEIDAASMDYELLYKLPDGRTQGVPGTIDLEGQDSIERELLLGSESSGNFRYDEGVERGTLTLRFRNDSGKLLTKFTTDFRLLSDTGDLASTDNNFRMNLARNPQGVFFVVMETFGVPGDLPGSLASGPYGVFSSEDITLSGTVEINEGTLYRWTGSDWETQDGDAPETGIYIGVSE